MKYDWFAIMFSLILIFCTIMIIFNFALFLHMLLNFMLLFLGGIIVLSLCLLIKYFVSISIKGVNYGNRQV